MTMSNWLCAPAPASSVPAAAPPPITLPAIREAVDSFSGGERPSFEEIQERLEASALPVAGGRRERRRG